MTHSLDVLLIESPSNIGVGGADQLEAAGHRVHRCFPDRAAGDDSAARPDLRLCLAVTDGTCPLEGGIDVAVLVRDRSWMRPRAHEAGAVCALRARVPLVEDGPDLFDPYGPYLAGRVDGDLVDVCSAAARLALEPLHDAIRERLSTVLVAEGIDIDAVAAHIGIERPNLRIVLSGPPVPEPVRQALGVRALDAVRADGRSFEKITVSYEVAAP